MLISLKYLIYMILRLNTLINQNCINHWKRRRASWRVARLIDGFQCPETRHRITSHPRCGGKNRAGHWPCSLTGIFSSSSRNARQSRGLYALRFAGRVKLRTYVRSYDAARERERNRVGHWTRRLLHVNHVSSSGTLHGESLSGGRWSSVSLRDIDLETSSFLCTQYNHFTQLHIKKL